MIKYQHEGLTSLSDRSQPQMLVAHQTLVSPAKINIHF